MSPDFITRNIRPSSGSLPGLRSENKLLQSLSLVDTLTGLPNRRAWEKAKEKAAASRNPVAIGFFDLDKFKEINDSLGHDEGDIAIREFGAFLRQILRGPDFFGRFGGDEFVALMTDPELDEQALANIKQNLTEKMAEHNLIRATDTSDIDFPNGKPPFEVSFSFKLAERFDKNDPKSRWGLEECRKTADLEMLEIKKLKKQLQMV